MHSGFDSKVSIQTEFMNLMNFFFSNFTNQALSRILTKPGRAVDCC